MRKEFFLKSKHSNYVCLLFIAKLFVLTSCARTAITPETDKLNNDNSVTVTSSFDSGRGSLREALKRTGITKIYFNIRSCIELKSNVVIKNSPLEINGVNTENGFTCIKGGGVNIRANNVSIRNVLIDRFNEREQSPHLTDGISINRAKNILIENVILGWTTDELIETWYPETKNILIKNSILIEPIHNRLTRPDEGHGHAYGPFFGNGSSNILFKDNIVIGAVRRNPRVSDSTNIRIANNFFIHYSGIGADLIGTKSNQTTKNIKIDRNLFVKSKKSAKDYRIKNATNVKFKANTFYYKELPKHARELIATLSNHKLKSCFLGNAIRATRKHPIDCHFDKINSQQCTNISLSGICRKLLTLPTP